MNAPVAAPLLDSSQAAFLNEPVAINVASRDSALTPSISRAYGCRLSADRSLVTVFLSTFRAKNLLRDLRAGAPVAVVFTRPKTHKALQIKAPNAGLAPLQPGDLEILDDYREAFSAELLAIGSGAGFAQHFVNPAQDDMVAVSLIPAELFEQTPGPAAGRRLEAHS